MAKRKNPAISVIIPMYNTEEYIEECLNSLLKQTLKNFEVIVADDCSTDNSLAIAEKFIPKFEKIGVTLVTIKFIKNSGCPGIPRNIAITDFAKGKYIYFLDSDDFLDEDVLETLYKTAEEFNADVVQAKFVLERKIVEGTLGDHVLNMDSGEVINKPVLETFDIVKRIDGNISQRYSGFVWNKIFRRELLIKNDIKFPAIGITEDHIFSTLTLLFAKNYVRIPIIGYHYRNYSSSVTKRSLAIEQKLFDMIEAVHYLDTSLQKHKFFVENPTYRYMVVDCFYQVFSKKVGKGLFFDLNYEMGEVYDFYCKNILSINPEKNIPLTAYLFLSSNVYKMLSNQQAEEIAQLKKIIEEGGFQNNS